MKGKVYIGTSGYVYDHWKNVVYPPNLKKSEWFSHYCTLFDALELNNTYYKLPSALVFKSWNHKAPQNFCYCFKFSRYATQMKKLKDSSQTVPLFYCKVQEISEEHRGPILVQLPPRFRCNVPRLREFLVHTKEDSGQRWAVEFRDRSWLCEEVYDLLKEFNAALCIHDHKDIENFHSQEITADWMYFRYHGEDYTKFYSGEELADQASLIKTHLEEGKDVYVFQQRF